MKVLKKNQIVIYVMALMLVVAGYFNYVTDNNKLIQTTSELEQMTGDELANIGDATLVSSNDVSLESKNDEEDIHKTVETNANINTNDYFEKSKLERQTMYSKMLESYQKIMENATVPIEQKIIATQEIKNINDIQNSIMICENLIMTKGFSNCVIFVNQEIVSAVVKAESDLNTEEIAQIQNIISREIQIPLENINISVKK